MNTNITKYAAAAVLIIGLCLGVSIFFSQGVTWGNVFEKLEQVNTVIYRNRLTMYDMPGAPGGGPIKRDNKITYSTGHGMLVETFAEGKLLSKSYALLDEEALVSVIYPNKQYTRINFTEEVFEEFCRSNGDPKKMVSNFTEYEYTELGRKTIDGVKAEGIESRDPRFAKGIMGDVVARLWVDVKAEWPVKITIEVRGKNDEKQMDVILDNFQWNVAIDPAEFEVQIPPGFEMAANVDMARLESGEAVVDGLRLFAELTDGKFPSDLIVGNLFEEIAAALENFEAQGGQLDSSNRQLTENMLNLRMIGHFYGGIKEHGADPAYYGDTVNIQDTDKVLMRWKMSDDKYRVIFGDLHIEDVSAEKLAQLEGR